MNNNLIPQSERTKEEQRKIAIKGGIASGKARRRKKLIKEQLELLLSLPLKDENAKRKLKQMGIDADNLDNQMAMVISIWNKALKGDVQAFNTIRDSVGEKPKEVIENHNYTKEELEKYKMLSIEELKKLAGE
jgi:Holliday junction resolvasome RuvABC ATP-dependent DNA helicase subunit